MSNRVYLYTTDDPVAGPYEDRAEADAFWFAWRVLMGDAPRLFRSSILGDQDVVIAGPDGLARLAALLDPANPKLAPFFSLWRARPPKAWLVLLPHEVMPPDQALRAIANVAARGSQADDGDRLAIGIASSSWKGVNFLPQRPAPAVPRARPEHEPVRRLRIPFGEIVERLEGAEWVDSAQVQAITALAQRPADGPNEVTRRIGAMVRPALRRGVVIWLEAACELSLRVHAQAPGSTDPPTARPLLDALRTLPEEALADLGPSCEAFASALREWTAGTRRQRSRTWSGGEDEADALWRDAPSRALGAVPSGLDLMTRLANGHLDQDDPLRRAWVAFLMTGVHARSTVSSLAALACDAPSVAATEREAADALGRVERAFWNQVYPRLLDAEP